MHDLPVARNERELSFHDREDVGQRRWRTLEDADPTDMHRTGVTLDIEKRRILEAHTLHLVRLAR